MTRRAGRSARIARVRHLEEGPLLRMQMDLFNEILGDHRSQPSGTPLFLVEIRLSVKF